MELYRGTGAKPLYLQLEEIIRSDIENGIYNKGDLLPSEKQYMDEYDVSRVTCRQAFALLAQNGYIQRFRGIGTVVAYEKISEEMNQVISLTEEMKKHNIVMHTTFCQMDLISPDTRVAVTLGILKTDQCYRLVRVRDVDGKPLVYTVTYLKKIVDLPTDPSMYTESLYRFVNEKYGICIARGTDTLEAALPNEEVQKMLQISSGSPIFIRTRKTYLKNDEIFEYSFCYYPGNRYKYSVEL